MKNYPSAIGEEAKRSVETTRTLMNRVGPHNPATVAGQAAIVMQLHIIAGQLERLGDLLEHQRGPGIPAEDSHE